jgi:hypothetical protein
VLVVPCPWSTCWDCDVSKLLDVLVDVSSVAPGGSLVEFSVVCVLPALLPQDAAARAKMTAISKMGNSLSALNMNPFFPLIIHSF